MNTARNPVSGDSPAESTGTRHHRPGQSHLDHHACYDAVQRRDRRFDGVFFTGVTSTGIFCRPSCPARTPAARNVVFFHHAAAAGNAGFRPCRRCRPELAPGHPEWNRRADLVGRALAMISCGAADQIGVAGMAGRLGVSERHLRRELRAELGVGPAQLIQNRRLTTARLLLDQTDLSITDIAFAAGFGSVRRFNEAFRAAFDQTPRELRRPGRSSSGVITLTLAGRSPLGWARIHRFLAARAIHGLETTATVSSGHGTAGIVGRYRRGVDGGWFELEAPLIDQPEPELTLRCHLTRLDQLATVVAQARSLGDLDTDRAAITASLSAGDPLMAGRLHLLGDQPPALPVGVDPFEVAVRAVVGQQVSVAAARTSLGRLLDLVDADHGPTDGQPANADQPTLRPGFPTADQLANAPLDRLGMPTRRRETLRSLAVAVADGSIDLSAAGDRRTTTEALLELPGVGPWTAGYIAMRALADPDGWPSGDLVLRQSLHRHSTGQPEGARPSVRELDEQAEGWRPWRAYAAMTLWATTDPTADQPRKKTP